MKRGNRAFFSCGMAAVLAATAGMARAHHALEFIETDVATSPARGQKAFYIKFDHMTDDTDNPRLDHWELTPGLSYGISDRWMVDAHAHYAKFGEDHVVASRAELAAGTGSPAILEAVALTTQYRLLEGGPVDVALAATVEIPLQDAKDWLGAEDEIYAGTLILSRTLGTHTTLALNLGVESEDGASTGLWAAGVKTPLGADPHGVAGGLEILGDFDGDAWEVLPGIYAPLVDGASMLKMGLGVGNEKREEGGSATTLHGHVSVLFLF